MLIDNIYLIFLGITNLTLFTMKNVNPDNVFCETFTFLLDFNPSRPEPGRTEKIDLNFYFNTTF